jgi:hypothetical protein
MTTEELQARIQIDGPLSEEEAEEVRALLTAPMAEGDDAAAGVDQDWQDVSVEERAEIRRAMGAGSPLPPREGDRIRPRVTQGRHPDIEILELIVTTPETRFQAIFKHGDGQQRGATPAEAEAKLFAELYYEGEVAQRVVGFDVLCCGMCGEKPGSCRECQGEKRIDKCPKCGGSGDCRGKAHGRST